jgi:hypothetical protein
MILVRPMRFDPEWARANLAFVADDGPQAGASGV